MKINDAEGGEPLHVSNTEAILPQKNGEIE
jgi:hypothetical protein